jgi:hypothetical protein
LLKFSCLTDQFPDVKAQQGMTQAGIRLRLE